MTIFEILGSAFLKKIEVKGGKGVKKWEFGETKIFLKYQLYIRFNLLFMCYGQFPPKSSLKLRFVLLQTWEIRNSTGFEIPAALEISQVWKGQISILAYS